MRAYKPKENLIVYATRFWPQKPITIPDNPNIRFEHIIKKTRSSASQPGTLTDIMNTMKNPATSQEQEEYTNSARLIYVINGKEISTIVYPGDYIVVYHDNMVVIKKHEQFIREYDEFANCGHPTSDSPGAKPEATVLREEKSSSHANVDDTIHNAPR